jgi:hypothetical protein
MHDQLFIALSHFLMIVVRLSSSFSTIIAGRPWQKKNHQASRRLPGTLRASLFVRPGSFCSHCSTGGRWTDVYHTEYTVVDEK